MIIHKETYFREGREQPVLGGRKSIPESILAIQEASGIADSLREWVGARDMLQSETALAEETQTLPQITLA